MALTRRVGLKVPQVTVFFWIVKALTTAMGEATSDFSVHQIDPVIAVALGAAAFAVAITLQLLVDHYIAPVYWLAVVMVAVFGTMCADVLHIRFKVPYTVTSCGFAVVLVVVFVAWYLTEGTLSIHSIDTRRRELFYWAAVVTTFALGTAVGDLTAYTLHLGFFSSGLMFAGIICIPPLAWRFAGLNSVAAFWAAYILTRPLGASFADWMGVPHSLGGLNMGRGPVSLLFTVLIVIFVAYLTVSRVDVTTEPQPPAVEPVTRGGVG